MNSKPFDILVTHVEKEHGLVKVFGQVDLKTSQVVCNRVSDGVFGNKDVDLQNEMNCWMGCDCTLKSKSKGAAVNINFQYLQHVCNQQACVLFFHTVELTENQV